MMKKIFGVVVFSTLVATTAFAAQEAHSWEELQRLCRVQLAQHGNQGNSTSDGGRLGYLKWDVEWKITDDWRVYSGSTVERRSGEVLPAGSEFYAWFLGGETPQEPTTPTDDDTKKNTEKDKPVEVSSFEELQDISSTPLQDNGDGGRGATLTKPLKVAAGQKVLCGSDTPLEEGVIVPAGQFVYVWLAPEGYGLKAAATLEELKAKGNLDAEEDGVWYTYSPNELVKFASEDIRAFDMDDFGNEVEDCLLRKDGAYRIFLKEKFKAFTPRNADDLKVLAHPKVSVSAGPVWTPEGRTIRNFYVVLASEWAVKENTDVYWNSNVIRSAGEIAPAGTKIMVSVEPIADPDRGGKGGERSGGGGGCDAGFGLLALAAVTPLALRKQRR